MPELLPKVGVLLACFFDRYTKSASEDLNALEKAPPQIIPLQILSGKGAVQIMPFWKLKLLSYLGS